MVIRPAVETDLPGILRVHQSNGLYEDPDPSSDYQAAMEYYVLCVADEGGEVVGFGLMRGASIDCLYVLAGRNGGGIGSRILIQLEAIAVEKRIDVLHVNANPHDKSKLDDLRRFYAAKGYIELLLDYEQGWAEFEKTL